jgi:hypothetical protein
MKYSFLLSSNGILQYQEIVFRDIGPKEMQFLDINISFACHGHPNRRDFRQSY